MRDAVISENAGSNFSASGPVLPGYVATSAMSEVGHIEITA